MPDAAAPKLNPDASCVGAAVAVADAPNTGVPEFGVPVPVAANGDAACPAPKMGAAPGAPKDVDNDADEPNAGGAGCPAVD